MKDEFALVIIVGIVLIFLLPAMFYYLGTLAGVNFAAMSVNLVQIGVFLFILFIAVLALYGYLRRH